MKHSEQELVDYAAFQKSVAMLRLLQAPKSHGGYGLEKEVEEARIRTLGEGTVALFLMVD